VAARAFDLLELVATSDEPCSLVNLAEQSGIDKSTVSRLLTFLVGRDLVNRDPNTRRYSVGVALLALSSPAVRRFGVHQIVGPILQHLRDQSGETATMHVRIGDDRVCTGGVESSHMVRRVVPLGERLPLDAGGASGRVITAFLPLPSRPMAEEQPGSKSTSTDETRGRIIASGYFAGIDDRTEGVAGLSAPIFSSQGVYGSVTIAGPGDRWTMTRMKAFAPELIGGSRKITAALGGSFPAVVTTTGVGPRNEP
jgi:IclR family transcriptional regulator, acetate operon repressor